MRDLLTAWNVAWYAAIVATLALAFNVWKWTRERPRLKVSIVPTVYEDGGFSKVEKTEHGEIGIPIQYLHVEVVNSGELPATILGIAATTRPAGTLERLANAFGRAKGETGLDGRAFMPHYGKTLPYVLGPGEVWSCRVKLQKMGTLCRRGNPKVELTATCWNRPRLIRIPRISRETEASEQLH